MPTRSQARRDGRSTGVQREATSIYAVFICLFRDRLDAVLCLVQAAWAAARPGWGQPAQIDSVEGWIVSA